MLKVITFIAKYIVITLMALLFGSCAKFGDINTISGSGNVTVEHRPVTADFKNIEISNALELVIEQSDKPVIIVEADDNLQKEITTSISNGVLTINYKSGNHVNVTKNKITVKMPVIEGIEASSAAVVTSNGILMGNNLILVTSSAASVNADLEYEKVQLTGSSASNQKIKGKALQVEATTSSASVIDSKDLLANDVKASASSGGSIHVHPLINFSGEASSGGSIAYSGTPKSIQKEENSGGSVYQD